jgi:CheY-like chemotaxis protein
MAHRILVAEDNPALAGVVRFNLEQAGLIVTLARNGREAWEALDRGDQIELVLTDQQMPEMNGLELCQKIREDGRFAKLPIIMLTAKGLELEVNRLRDEMGVQEVVSKPFSPRELTKTIQTCLLAGACAAGAPAS